jgi:5-methylcytosine-specific restriction endonuclease McrA
MRSIPLLATDAIEVFDEITAAKRQPRRKRMQAVRSKVLAAYQDYELAAPEVAGLEGVTLTPLQKDAMRHAYTVETSPMTELRSNLLKRISVARCPFCGINESSTLDHYLPKEKYPEFSVFPMNLVPSCAICNTRKRDRILDGGTNVRMFLHPCYDTIPDAAFVDVRVRMEEDALIVTYRVVRPVGIELHVFQHLKSHFEELNLADRYRRMGIEHLGGQYPALRRAFGLGKDGIRVAEKLIEGAEDFEEVAGPNYWLAKLYRALASNKEFCEGGFEAIRVQRQPA